MLSLESQRRRTVANDAQIPLGHRAMMDSSPPRLEPAVQALRQPHSRSDTLILLSATPPDGTARSFASLMALLDPTVISDPDDSTPQDDRHKGLVMRLFQKDIRHQVTGDFRERHTIKLTPQASEPEEAAYRALLGIRFTQAGVHRGGTPQELQRVAMPRAIFSSPFAALESTHTRLHRLTRARQPTADEAQEVED